MFTGLILAVGSITRITPHHNELHLTISAGKLDVRELRVGDSMAVNGVCLTITALNAQGFETWISEETLRVTTGLNTLGSVNLELSLKMGDTLGGHLVIGHVDAMGTVLDITEVGECKHLCVRLPQQLMPFIAVKGSLCLHGVSLTINAVTTDTVSVNLIPHTLLNTTLGSLQLGDTLNVEVDLIARYLVRWQEYAALNAQSMAQFSLSTTPIDRLDLLQLLQGKALL